MLQPPHEKIGVVDAQWIEHKVLPSLGNQVLISLFLFIINNVIFDPEC